MYDLYIQTNDSVAGYWFTGDLDAHVNDALGETFKNSSKYDWKMCDKIFFFNFKKPRGIKRKFTGNFRKDFLSHSGQILNKTGNFQI